MSWYTRGTAAVTAGSKTVVCDKARFTDFISAGEGFLGPDANIYEVESVVSATTITLKTPYAGATLAAGAYQIVPIQGYSRELALRASELIDAHAAVPAEALSHASAARDAASDAAKSLSDTNAAATLLRSDIATANTSIATSVSAASTSAAAALASQNAAKTSETNAASSKTAAASSATAAASSATASTTAKTASETAKTASETAKTASEAARDAAKTSELNAASSKDSAAASATAAAGSATAAATSETNALASKNAAKTSETNAAASATAAAASKTAAGTSETNALASKNAAATSQTAAATSATNAAASATAASGSATASASSASAAAASAADAKVKQDAAAASAADAKVKQDAAAASATAAAASQGAAATSETNAAASATAAAASKTAAATSETNAAASKTAAGTSETNALASKNAAATSATNAAASATAAASSATAASGSATAAATSKTAAATSETNAATSKTAAAASATAAASSATAASGSATAAASSATAASDSAADAKVKQDAAAASATAAASSASAAAASESTVAASAAAALASQNAAKTSETNAAASKTAAATSETNAASSKTAAATSATNAANSATAAASSATAANTSKTAAATSETNALASKNAAAASATAAASSATAADASATAAAGSAAASQAIYDNLAGRSAATIDDASIATTTTWSSTKASTELAKKLNATDTAVAATKLATARTINGKSFDGTANISFSWVGTAISTNGTDLNTLQTEGAYFCSANATAATLLNCPTTNAFSLQVWKAAGVVQELTEYLANNSRKTFQRAYYSSAWSEWVQILASNNAPVTSLVASNSSTNTANAAATNTNTFLNAIDAVPGAAASTVGSSVQVTGAGTVTVATDAAGKLTITGAQAITGNAGTATKLATARTIAIGNTSVSFDGSGNVAFAPGDIGAAGPNVLPNSSAENPSTQAGRAQYWAFGGNVSGLVGSLVDSALGGKAQRLEVATANAGQYIELRNGGDSSITPSEPGKVWTLSSYARGTPGMEFRMYIQALNSAGTVLGTSTSATAIISDQFQRFTLLTKASEAPAGTVKLNVFLGRIINNSGAAAPLWFELDNVQLQEGAWLSPYATNPNESVFGQGAWLDKTVDLNALVTPGEYYTQQSLSAHANGPAGVAYWGMIRVSRLDARIIQEVISDTAPYVYLARYSTNSGSTWKAWSAIQLADSATKLATARTINGTAFDGTANITVNGPWLGNTAEAAMQAGTDQPTRPVGIYVDGIYGGAAKGFPINYGNRIQISGHGFSATELFHEWASGATRLFARARGDVNTHSWTPAREIAFTDSSITGNAATATKLATARTIALSGGATGTATAFDGSGNISIPITGLNADNLNAGTVPNARMAGTYDGMSLKVNGANTVFSDPSAGNSQTNARVIFGMASYRSSSSAATGAIVITAPTNASAIMHEIEVTVMTYTPARVAKVLANGYRSSSTAFANTATVQLGSQAIQVRWGIDADGKTSLILGDVNTVWSYPHASASIGMVSHTGAADSYCIGWTANLVTDLSTYTGIVSPADTAVATDITGNAATATKLATARALTIGNTAKNFDGSAALSWTLGEIGAADAGHTHGNYLPLNGSARMTGQLGAVASVGAIGDATGSKGGLEVIAAGAAGDAAFMSFHRPGVYAAYFGLDTNNKWSVGGWSAGANSYALFHEGNLQPSVAKLTTARTIGGVSFDGTANINLPGVNVAGNQSTTGNAATATKLATARALTVGNTAKNFDGTAALGWTLAEIGALPAAGGTVTGQINLPSTSSSWITGTSGDNATFKLAPSSAASWHAWASQKTSGGNAFAIGQLGESWYLSWASAANINAGTNATTQILRCDGAGMEVGGTLRVSPPSGGEGQIYIGTSGGYAYGNAGSIGFYKPGIGGCTMDNSANWNVPNGVQASTVRVSDWLRTTGNCGWYSESYGGGMMMLDATWVRVYNGKSLYVPGEGAFTGNLTAYYSDKRLKTKLKPIKGAVAAIKQLTGYHYHANKLGAKYGYDPEKAEVGLLAQDVQAVIPEVVEQAPFDRTGVKGESKTGKHYLTLKYERLVPHLVEAIKELDAKNQALELRLSKLEALIASK